MFAITLHPNEFAVCYSKWHFGNNHLGELIDGMVSLTKLSRPTREQCQIRTWKHVEDAVGRLRRASNCLGKRTQLSLRRGEGGYGRTPPLLCGTCWLFS